MPVQISRHPTRRGVYQLEARLWLPCPRTEVFDFFADAFHLEDLTPQWLNFQVRTPRPIIMGAGVLIDYRLKLHGIPFQWQTEISLWEPPFRFVDRQLCGPYRLWEHLHTFEEHDGGTLCRDQVNYGFFGGPLVHRLLVKRDLERIFAYRSEQLRRQFSKMTSAAAEDRHSIIISPSTVRIR